MDAKKVSEACPQAFNSSTDHTHPLALGFFNLAKAESSLDFYPPAQASGNL
jgi:hypothetical protein